MLRRILALTTIVLISAAWPAGAAGPPFEFTVKRGHFIGASRGTLVFASDGVQYRTSDKKDARQWTYRQIKQVQVRSPGRIEILTYEDQGRLKFGADRTFTFELTRGAVGADLAAFLLERVDRPVVTAVMPPLPPDPLFRVPVKHERQGRGSEGTLDLYANGLAYLTDRQDDARYWRFSDLFSVLRLDRDRLKVRAYEGGGGGIRPFVFELQADLPPGFYEALWQQVNRPAVEGPRGSVGLWSRRR
jgi:hypothetical protein